MHVSFLLLHFSIIFVDNDDNVGMDDHDREISPLFELFLQVPLASIDFSWEDQRKKDERHEEIKGEKLIGQKEERDYVSMYVYIIVGEKGSDRRMKNMIREKEEIYLMVNIEIWPHTA